MKKLLFLLLMSIGIGTSPYAPADEVYLRWSQPDGGSVVQGYNIYRREGPAEPIKFTLNQPDLAFNDNTVKDGVTYDYWVTAFNSSGESGPSNVVTLTIPISIPDDPQTLRWAIVTANKDGTFTVLYTDGTSRTVTAEELPQALVF